MIKIILVEDEPAAMRYLRSIIELKCSGFEIVDTAENGDEGLEKIRSLKPDIVITDIKMGAISGIELISKIKGEFPFIYSVIVSGYQDFEYAKGALKCGAVDYLLKPVNINQLISVLDSIKEKLELERSEKRVTLLRSILKGAIVDQWQVNRNLPFKYYSAAILRINGLPSRFSSKHGSIDDNIKLETTKLLEIKNNNNNIWSIPGRDEHELIFFHCSEISGEGSFEKSVIDVGESLNYGYHTIVFSSKVFSLMDSPKVVLAMCRTLDNSLVMGFSQKIYENEKVKTSTEKRMILDEVLVNKINFLLSNMMYDDLNKEFKKLFIIWEKEKRTQLWVENSLRQIFYYIEKHSSYISKEENFDMELLLEEVLYYSTTFSELFINIWSIIEKITKRAEKKNQKIGSQEFFKSTQKYVEENLSEPLSLQSVCLMFGISQTYLSRLFRKYENMTFNEYLTMKRIDKAKQLISENPKMPLKDVALFVGYSDPFYFSRVFRSLVGIPPSEYTLLK